MRIDQRAALAHLRPILPLFFAALAVALVIAACGSSVTTPSAPSIAAPSTSPSAPTATTAPATTAPAPSPSSSPSAAQPTPQPSSAAQSTAISDHIVDTIGALGFAEAELKAKSSARVRAAWQETLTIVNRELAWARSEKGLDFRSGPLAKYLERLSVMRETLQKLVAGMASQATYNRFVTAANGLIHSAYAFGGVTGDLTPAPALGDHPEIANCADLAPDLLRVARIVGGGDGLASITSTSGSGPTITIRARDTNSTKVFVADHQYLLINSLLDRFGDPDCFPAIVFRSAGKHGGYLESTTPQQVFLSMFNGGLSFEEWRGQATFKAIGLDG
jgi:hypothetical protein